MGKRWIEVKLRAGKRGGGSERQKPTKRREKQKVARGAETPTNKLLQREVRKRAAEKGKKMTAEQNAFISGSEIDAS